MSENNSQDEWAGAAEGGVYLEDCVGGLCVRSGRIDLQVGYTLKNCPLNELLSSKPLRPRVPNAESLLTHHSRRDTSDYFEHWGSVVRLMLNPISVRNSLSPIFDPTRSVLADQSIDDALALEAVRITEAAVPMTVRSITVLSSGYFCSSPGLF